MNCDLIKDRYGWWMQYVTPVTGKLHCYLLDATTEAEAALEAQEEGFDVMHVWIDGKQDKTVCIPKQSLAK